MLGKVNWTTLDSINQEKEATFLPIVLFKPIQYCVQTCPCGHVSYANLENYNFHFEGMGERQLRQQARDWMLPDMLWELHGLFLRSGRPSIRKVI